MTRCNRNNCKNCTCGRFGVSLAANSNFPPTQKPKTLVRRDPLVAAVRLERRFIETMKILS